jgi:transposase
MALGYRPVDRAQQFLLPPDMADWLEPGHLVWFVLDVVAQMDTAVFHAKARTGGVGRAGYDPDMLLALLVYAYSVGERSSRAIERRCGTDVAFRVICAGDAPDHTRIARFRQEHEAAFTSLFEQVLVLCAKAGMGRLGIVAIDGTKIGANASLDANRRLEWLREQAEQVVGEAEALDAAEDRLFGPARGDELAPEFRDPSSRAERIRAALEQAEAQARAVQELAESDRAAAREYLLRIEQGSPPKGHPPRGVDRQAADEARVRMYRRLMDEADTPEQRWARAAQLRRARLRISARWDVAGDSAGKPASARPGSSGLKSFRGNVTDPDSRIMKTRKGWLQSYNTQLAVSADHLILSVFVTQDPTDVGAFEPVLRSAEDAAALVEANRPAEVAAGCAEHEEAASQAGIGLVLADAGYLSEANLTTPGPPRLIAVGKDHAMRQTTEAEPARGAPPANASPNEVMRHRMRTPEALAMYKKRGAIVEPVNGHVKDQIGLRRLSRRGLKAATSEINLVAAVTNLRKLHLRAVAHAT